MSRAFLCSISFCSLLLGIGSLHAADTVAVAATLPDEASECRYILRLCEGLRPQQELLKANTAESERMLEADEHVEQQTSAQMRERLIRGRLMQKQLQQQIDVSLARGKELHDAMSVVRAKHEQMPACFEQCQDVIELDGFR